MAQPFDPKAQRLTGDPIPVVQQVGTGPYEGHFSVTAGGVLAYRTGPGNRSQLTWVDRAGKVLDTAGDPGQSLTIALSPDEKQVAVFRSEAQAPTAGDIWLLDLARNAETRLTTGQTAAVTVYGPVWSPDGKQLAFASGNGIYIKDGGGATDAKLVKDLGHPVLVTDWTRDGRFLIYQDPSGNIRRAACGRRQAHSNCGRRSAGIPEEDFPGQPLDRLPIQPVPTGGGVRSAPCDSRFRDRAGWAGDSDFP